MLGGTYPDFVIIIAYDVELGCYIGSVVMSKRNVNNVSLDELMIEFDMTMKRLMRYCHEKC